MACQLFAFTIFVIQVDLLKQKKELEKRVVEMTDGGLIQPLIVEDQQTVEVLDGMWNIQYIVNIVVKKTESEAVCLLYMFPAHHTASTFNLLFIHRTV